MAFKDYHNSFPHSIQGTEAESGKWLKTAAASECRWLIVPEVGTIRVRQEKPVYYITVHQSVYDVNTGTVVDIAEFSTGTYNLTPLEAFAHAFKGIVPPGCMDKEPFAGKRSDSVYE